MILVKLSHRKKEVIDDMPIQISLKAARVNAEKHSKAMQDVIWSRGVQYGAYEVPNLFNEALAYIPNYSSEWDLSYVDDKRFDYDLIAGVYEANKSDEWISPRLSDDVYQSIYNRMDSEKSDALTMFINELHVRA